jgi:hypothetical protein
MLPVVKKLRPAALVLALMALPNAVAADPVFLLGAHYGAPTRAAATAGVLIPVGTQPEHDIQPSVMRRGLIVDAAIGAGGQQLSAGWGARMHEGNLLLLYGLDFSATLTRTTNSPRSAAANSLHAGASAGLNLSVVRVTAGIERRISGASGPKATIFTWSVGVQVPLGWAW